MIRLAVLVAALVAGFLAFWVFDLVSTEQVQDWIEPLGAFAIPAFVVLSALLGAALVPGPLLAGASGVLFGAAVGTAVTIASATLSAVISLHIARGTGQTAPPHLAELAQRHGTLAVAGQRLLPAVPDAPASYAFGLLGVRTWQIALGTVVGSAPRAFSYTSIGASLDEPGSPLAIAGWAGVVLTGIAGTLLAVRWSRRRDASAGTAPRPAPRARP